MSTEQGEYNFPGAAQNFIDAYANTNYLRPLNGDGAVLR